MGRTAGIALVALLLAGSGCRGTAPLPAREIAVAVTNDMNLGPATVFVRSFDVERALGVVQPFETRTLWFSGSTLARPFQLRAIVGGREVFSKSFDIPSEADVAWAMRTNFVRPVRRP
jgi:hypothetical protein